MSNKNHADKALWEAARRQHPEQPIKRRPEAAGWRYGLYAILALLLVVAWVFDDKHSFPVLSNFVVLLFAVFAIETARHRRRQ